MLFSRFFFSFLIFSVIFFFSEPSTRKEDSDIPPALRQLMEQYQVSDADIRRVVAMRGYYPESTPISNYDPQFVSGVLIGAWQQVYQMIKGA